MEAPATSLARSASSVCRTVPASLNTGTMTERVQGTGSGFTRKQQTCGRALERIAGRGRVLGKRLDGVERDGGEIHSKEFCRPGEHVMGHGDYVAAAFFGLENIQHFPNAGPEQFGFGQTLQERPAGAHDRHRVTAGVGDAAAKLSLIHISEPTRPYSISYAVF